MAGSTKAPSSFFFLFLVTLFSVVVSLGPPSSSKLPEFKFPPVPKIDDTFDNREHYAKKYSKVAPVEDMLYELVEFAQAQNTSAADMAKLRAAMDLVEAGPIEEAIQLALIKHMTAEELAFMVGIYSSRFGRSMLKKFKHFMADVQPAIQGQVNQAMQIVEKRGLGGGTVSATPNGMTSDKRKQRQKKAPKVEAAVESEL